MIPFVNLVAQRNLYREELEKAEARVLDSGSYVGGQEVQNLEKEYHFQEVSFLFLLAIPIYLKELSGYESTTILLYP